MAYKLCERDLSAGEVKKMEKKKEICKCSCCPSMQTQFVKYGDFICVAVARNRGWWLWWFCAATWRNTKHMSIHVSSIRSRYASKHIIPSKYMIYPCWSSSRLCHHCYWLIHYLSFHLVNTIIDVVPSGGKTRSIWFNIFSGFLCVFLSFASHCKGVAYSS